MTSWLVTQFHHEQRMENWPQHLSGSSIRKHQRIILSTDGLGLAMVNVLIRIAVISVSYKDEPWIFYDKSISNTLWAGFKPQGVLNPFPCIKIVDTDAFFCKNSFLICWSWEFTRGNARGFSFRFVLTAHALLQGKRDKMSREMHYIYTYQKEKSGSYFILKPNA